MTASAATIWILSLYFPLSSIFPLILDQSNLIFGFSLFLIGWMCWSSWDMGKSASVGMIKYVAVLPPNLSLLSQATSVTVGDKQVEEDD